MKKYLIALAGIVFSANTLADANTDQLKLKIVEQLYQADPHMDIGKPGSLENYISSRNGTLARYITADFKKAFAAAKNYDEHKSDPDDYEDFCNWHGIYGSGQDYDLSKPVLKLVNGAVQAKYRYWKTDKKTKMHIKFIFECTKGKCLISDFLYMPDGYSSKKTLLECASQKSKR